MCYSTISNNEQQILSKITLFVLVTSVVHIIISQQPYVSGTKIIVTTRKNNFFSSKYYPNLSVVGGAQKSTSIQEETSYDDDDDDDGGDDNDDDEIINSELDRPNALFGWSFISAFKVNEQAKEELLNEDKEYDQNKKGFDLSSIQQKTIVGGAKTVKSSSLSTEEIDQKQDPKNLITNPKAFTIQSQKNRIKEVATASDRLIDDDSEKEKELQAQDESTSSVDQTEDYYSYEYDEDESLLYDFVYDEGSDVDGLIINSSTKEEETSPNTTALEKMNNSNSLKAKLVSAPTVRINEPMTETSFAKNISTMVSKEGESSLQVNYVDKEKLDLSETRLSNISKSITTPTPSNINSKFLLPPPSLSVNQIKEATSSTDSVFISTGYWETIDKVVSFGFSSSHPSLRLSRRLRTLRKTTASITGMHGILSGKKKSNTVTTVSQIYVEEEQLNEEDLGIIRRRIAAIENARGKISQRIASDQKGLFLQKEKDEQRNRGLNDLSVSSTSLQVSLPREQLPKVPVWRRALRVGRRNRVITNINTNNNYVSAAKIELDETERLAAAAAAAQEEINRNFRAAEMAEEKRRKIRVQEIDRLIQKGQKQIVELQCEKDYLQRRPNPFYNYTKSSALFPDTDVNNNVDSSQQNSTSSSKTRLFNFPSGSLVNDYIEELKRNKRLVMLNHTLLWRSNLDDDKEDEDIGDDIFTPSADARKLYESKERKSNTKTNSKHKNVGNGNGGGGGSWILRQTIGKATLGEKLGETVEVAAYKAVCSAVMSVLARSIAAIHGLNIMEHSDIRLFIDQTPDLPPTGDSSDVLLNAENYAQKTIETAIQRGAAKRHSSMKKRRQQQQESYYFDTSFMQRDAVVETLISHCQISAPLLKLFPIAWQRAILSNIITLIAAVASDFCGGIKLQILGHQLSLSFKPITEMDLIQNIGAGGLKVSHRRQRPQDFEEAVSATARDISDGMKFLDKWHERALGSGMLRAQIGNLIARVVLTLVDEVLSGARMDLWSAQVGGPRVIAGLEYRLDDSEKSDSTKDFDKSAI